MVAYCSFRSPSTSRKSPSLERLKPPASHPKFLYPPSYSFDTAIIDLWRKEGGETSLNITRFPRKKDPSFIKARGLQPEERRVE